MPRAEFTVDIPERIWIGDLSRTYPDATFRVLSAFPAETSGYGLLEIESPAVDAIVAAVEEYGGIRSFEVVQRMPERAVTQFETTELPLLVTIQRAQVPLELPIELHDGTVTLSLTAPRERLSEFGTQLDALGISYRLDRIYRSVEAEEPLTGNQRELLVAALEHGYYDTPRRITLTDLAEELDMAPSTVSETLHRAEETIVKTFAANRLGLDPEE